MNIKEIKIKEKIKKESSQIRIAVREKVWSYLAAALGLVAGLAWNEAIKSLIEYFFPMKENSVAAKFSYALFITIFIVLSMVYLERFFNKQENKELENENIGKSKNKSKRK